MGDLIEGALIFGGVYIILGLIKSSQLNSAYNQCNGDVTCPAMVAVQTKWSWYKDIDVLKGLVP